MSLVLLAVTTSLATAHAQSVNEIITDFGGYWRSSATSINSTKPNNSHNLLAYSYNGARYSTGVSDSTLRARGLSFVAGDYRALPFYRYSGIITSNTKIGLGELYDGVSNGASTPAPVNDIPKYLTDGKKGLDLGTCVANLPAGDLFFAVDRFSSALINDGIPDMLVTQVADPSGSSDKYSFVDVAGNLVGRKVSVNLGGVPSVGNWTVDFYEAANNPMTLTSGFTKTDRPIRLYAADFSAFGIDDDNIARIAYFRIELSGNSDVAFVSYNVNTVTLGASLLPTKLSAFNASRTGDAVSIKWTSVSEIDADHYEVEASSDGRNFKVIANVAAIGKPGAQEYSFTDHTLFVGTRYYRLRMVDHSGASTTSRIASVRSAEQSSTSIYPNPASDVIHISNGTPMSDAKAELFSAGGVLVRHIEINDGSTSAQINVHGLTKGVYHLRLQNGTTTQTFMVAIQ